MRYLESTVAALIATAVVAFGLPAYGGDWTETDVFVDADDAAAKIEAGAAVIDAREDGQFERGHIAGAANLQWQQFVDGDTSGALIDDDDRLNELLTNAGISADEPVVVYGAWDDGWGEEGRLFWTLEYLGHDDVHLLDGGLASWNRAGQPLATGEGEASPGGDFHVDRRDEHRQLTDDLQRRLDNGQSTAVIDTRDRDEFNGDVKYGEQRGGHIPDAKHLWWHDLLDDDGSLIDADAFDERVEELGIDTDDTVVAYCTGGVRSGFVYAVLRARGFEDVRNYDASMWDWTRDENAPVE